MPTRRDQRQARRFQDRRAISALVTGRPNALDAPMRGLPVVTMSGLAFALIVLAVVAATSLLGRPGSADWRAAGAVIVENETGAAYVRLQGVLHPALNYPSAVLAAGSQHAHVVHVDRARLDGTPRGPTVGIDGLPSMPPADRLTGSPFDLCSRTQAGPGATATARVAVRIGDGRAAVPNAVPVPVEAAVLVRSAGDGGYSLLYQGRRRPIGSTRIASSFALDTGPPMTVGTALLDGTTPGPAVDLPTVPGAGQVSTMRIGAGPVRVGQLLHDTTDGRYLLVLRDGTAAVTPVEARVLEALPVTPSHGLADPQPVSASELITLPSSSADWRVVSQQLTDLPSALWHPTSATAGSGLCERYRAGSSTPVLTVLAGTQPNSPSTVTESARSARGLADVVEVAGGGAALLRPDDPARAVYLVGAPGRRYAAASLAVLAGFGYGDVAPAVVPARLLAVIATGPALDPGAARTPVAP